MPDARQATAFRVTDQQGTVGATSKAGSSAVELLEPCQRAVGVVHVVIGHSPLHSAIPTAPLLQSICALLDQSAACHSAKAGRASESHPLQHRLDSGGQGDEAYAPAGAQG